MFNLVLGAGLMASLALNALQMRGGPEQATNLRANVPASFNPTIEEPRIGAGTYVDPLASIIGDVRLGRRTMVAPFASIRGDEGQPVRLGSRTNVQDGVVIHALETVEGGEVVEKNLVEQNGRKYAVYIGDQVSLAHQSQVHGPAKVGDNTYVGMQALVFRAEVGEGCVLEPAAKVIGVKIESGRYVPAGMVVTTQAQADALPVITPDYAFRTLNDEVIGVNTQLADGYLGNGRLERGDVEPKTRAAEPAAAGQAEARPRTSATPAPSARVPTARPTAVATATYTPEARPATAVSSPTAGAARH